MVSSKSREIHDDRNKDSRHYISRSEIRTSGRAVRPRDSSTLILVRTDLGKPRLLMGKRSPKHKFMPNKFVFPGGVVDRSDSRVHARASLQLAVFKRLKKGCSAARARALAIAAIRETFEETGLVVGKREDKLLCIQSPIWKKFLSSGANPRLDQLQYIARAITPPYRSRRYDARFFLMCSDRFILEQKINQNSTDELSNISWFTLDEARSLQLPHITRIILEEVEKRISTHSDFEVPGPFIHFRYGKLVRDWQ